MPIYYSAILPHGFDLIEELYPQVREEWLKLRTSFKEVALSFSS
ncbi:MAG: hypothetical protein ACTSP3_17345 [Candidatus Heimdallarchaeaceae archaeon]